MLALLIVSLCVNTFNVWMIMMLLDQNSDTTEKIIRSNKTSQEMLEIALAEIDLVKHTLQSQSSGSDRDTDGDWWKKS